MFCVSVSLDLVTHCLHWRCHELMQLCNLNKWWSLAITYWKLTSTSQSVLQRRGSSWLKLHRRGTCRLTGCVWAPTALVTLSYHIAISSRQMSRLAAALTDILCQLMFTMFGFLSVSLYFSKRGAYWDRLCRDVVGRWSLVGCHARALWPNGAS